MHIERLVAAAALVFSALVSHAATVPPEVQRRVNAGEAVTVIVEYDARAIDADLATQRARLPRGMASDALLDSARTRYQALKAGADRRAARPGGVNVLRDHSHLPMRTERVGSATALAWLAAHPGVLAIYEDGTLRPVLAQSLPLIGEPTALAAGYGGAGTTVAVIDTAVDITNAAFGGCTAVGTPAGCRLVAQQSFPAAPDSDTTHGTNMAATVLGVAPQAGIAVLNVFNSSGGALFSNVVAATGNAGHVSGVFTPDIAKPACTAGVVSVSAVYDGNVGGLLWGTSPNQCSDRTSAALKSCWTRSSTHQLRHPGCGSQQGRDFAKTISCKDIYGYHRGRFMSQAQPSSAPARRSTEPRRQSLSAEEAIRAIQSSSRYFFEATEFAQLVGRDVHSQAVKKALHRLALRGLIVLATKRPAGWLIVPAEQAHYGAPPVTWWLDDCLKRTEPHYYVALLSAARHWGSAHYAVQDTQVMLSKPRLALTPGRLTVTFFSKQAVDRTPTVVVTSGVAPWRVSTREATLLDLLRHQSGVGGIESVARIARDLAPEISPRGLTQALDALGQVPVAQRLGYVFDHLGLDKLARLVAAWLEGRRTLLQPLELQVSPDENRPEKGMGVDSRWKIQYDTRRLHLFKELT